MSIGESLAEARRRAGLSLTQVSQQTRIRETIIQGIENDDYTACGGDFYARGHIRSIAKAVGADPGPLIRAYDGQRRQHAVTAGDVSQPVAPIPATPVMPVTAVTPATSTTAATPGTATPGTATPGTATPGTATPGTATPGTATPGTATPHQRRRRSQTAALAMVLALVVALDLVTYHILSGPGHSARTAAQARTSHGVRTHAARSRPGLRPTARPRPQQTAAAAPQAAVPARTLIPVSAAAFGTNGAGQGDNPGAALLAIDGSRASAWHTDWYTSARLGNLYPGTGLLLDMGHTVAITGARIILDSDPGAGFQLRTGAVPALAGLRPVARVTGAAGVVWLRLTTPARGRYVLIWFTRLPPDPAGTFRASVHDVRLLGRV